METAFLLLHAPKNSVGGSSKKMPICKLGREAPLKTELFRVLIMEFQTSKWQRNELALSKPPSLNISL